MAGPEETGRQQQEPRRLKRRTARGAISPPIPAGRTCAARAPAPRFAPRPVARSGAPAAGNNAPRSGVRSGSDRTAPAPAAHRNSRDRTAAHAPAPDRRRPADRRAGTPWPRTCRPRPASRAPAAKPAHRTRAARSNTEMADALERRAVIRQVCAPSIRPADSLAPAARSRLGSRYSDTPAPSGVSASSSCSSGARAVVVGSRRPRARAGRSRGNRPRRSPGPRRTDDRAAIAGRYQDRPGAQCSRREKPPCFTGCTPSLRFSRPCARGLPVFIQIS
jgi:hypothetical protein